MYFQGRSTSFWEVASCYGKTQQNNHVQHHAFRKNHKCYSMLLLLIKNGSEATLKIAFGKFVTSNFSSLVKCVRNIRAPGIIDRSTGSDGERLFMLLSFPSGVPLVIAEIDWYSWSNAIPVYVFSPQTSFVVPFQKSPIRFFDFFDDCP